MQSKTSLTELLNSNLLPTLKGLKNNLFFISYLSFPVNENQVRFLHIEKDLFPLKHRMPKSSFCNKLT